MSEHAIQTEQLSKAYGSHPALTGLDLEVRTGEVYGFLGPNGAGKSTTIRLLLDLLRPTSGRVRVLGMDPLTKGIEIRSRTGYLAGELALESRQNVDELLRFLARLRGGAGRDRIPALADRLDLDLSRQIKGLSKGNKQKVGIVQAFMHDPELLILDEPTSGLDPLMRQVFLELVSEARLRGATVFMSSHVLSEVQTAADRVGIIRGGRLVTVDDVEAIRRRAVRRVEIQFATEVPESEFSRLPNVSDLEVRGSELHCQVNGVPDALVKAAARFEVLDIVSEEPDLEEIFIGEYEEAQHAH